MLFSLPQVTEGDIRDIHNLALHVLLRAYALLRHDKYRVAFMNPVIAHEDLSEMIAVAYPRAYYRPSAPSYNYLVDAVPQNWACADEASRERLYPSI